MIKATTTYVKRAGALVTGLFTAFVLLTSAAVADELKFYGLLAKEIQDETIKMLNEELADEIGCRSYPSLSPRASFIPGSWPRRPT